MPPIKADTASKYGRIVDSISMDARFALYAPLLHSKGGRELRATVPWPSDAVRTAVCRTLRTGRDSRSAACCDDCEPVIPQNGDGDRCEACICCSARRYDGGGIDRTAADFGLRSASVVSDIFKLGALRQIYAGKARFPARRRRLRRSLSGLPWPACSPSCRSRPE